MPEKKPWSLKETIAQRGCSFSSLIPGVFLTILETIAQIQLTNTEQVSLRPLHGNWCVFCLLIHCIIGSYFVYLSIKNSIIFLSWHTNSRIPMSM
ncbi:hypothetical protein CS544_07375 [Porphyromonas gingivalis]|nr:hypothetical protein CS544_07375 [Porphyromonas gingivalis]